MSDEPKVVVFDRDWSEPHDGTGEGGEARIYTLDVYYSELSTEDVLDTLESNDEEQLWSFLFDIGQDHVDYTSTPIRSDWDGFWVIRIAPGGTSVSAEAP